MPTPQKINKRERVSVLGLNVDVCDYASAVRAIAGLARSGGGYVCVANVHMTMEAFDDPQFAAQVNAADLVVPDGRPLVWMQKRSGQPSAEQVRGPSLMPILMDEAVSSGLNIGFYGGTPDVLEALNKNAGETFPELRIKYSFSPPFREMSAAETGDVIEGINATGTQILFVGLGCPKQERWMAANTGRINAVMIGVGAAFDIFAGRVSEAPIWMRRSGIEWLYRFAQEPKRLWRRYLILNTRFVFHSLRQIISGKKG